MARKKKKGKRGTRTRKTVTIKRHTRTPRGPNRGKPPVRVRAHRRGKPKR